MERVLWHQEAAGEFKKALNWRVKPLVSRAHGHWGTKAELPGKFAVSFSTQENGEHIATIMHKKQSGGPFEITHTISADLPQAGEANKAHVFSLPMEKREELARVIRRTREYLKKHAPKD